MRDPRGGVARGGVTGPGELASFPGSLTRLAGETPHRNRPLAPREGGGAGDRRLRKALPRRGPFWRILSGGFRPPVPVKIVEYNIVSRLTIYGFRSAAGWVFFERIGHPLVPRQSPGAAKFAPAHRCPAHTQRGDGPEERASSPGTLTRLAGE